MRKHRVVLPLCLQMLLCPFLCLAADDVRALEPGQTVTRDIKGGEAHLYSVALAAGQYLSVSIEQRGVDLAVSLIAATGVKEAEANIVRGLSGRETLTFIADNAGDYRLEVRPADKNASAGQYDASIGARRAPTEDERTLEGARRLTAEGRTLRQRGKYAEAVPPAERALAIREKVLGPDHPAVADSLHLLAVIYDDQSEYAKAEPLNLRALAIRERALGGDHPDVARSLFNLAWILKVRQDFAQAEALYKRTLAIQERAFGVTHTEVATTLNDLAVLYSQKGDLDQAILIKERVLAIREKALGPDDDGVAKALNNLARSYELKGDLPKAESLFDRARATWERSLGPEHPDVANALDGLARTKTLTGDYAAAEPLYHRALVIREKSLGPDHREVATTLHNLAVLYRQKGDYTKAERLLLRDLAITEKALGPSHAFVAPTLQNLASIYQLQGNYTRAEPLYRRALTIQEQALGPDHAEVGWTLNLLGLLYIDAATGREAEAEGLLERSQAIMEKALGPDHYRLASPLRGRAALAASHGDRASAERYYRRALAIQEQALGPDHPDVTQSLERLASLYEQQGDVRRALTLLSRAHDARERHLEHNLPLGSERQKRGYLRLFADDIDQALSLHAQLAPRDPEALELAFTTLLRRKGRALDAATDNASDLRVRALPQDRDLFGRLSGARSQLAALTLRGPGRGDEAAYRSRLQRYEEEVDQLEAEIGNRSAEFRAQSRAITLDAVRTAIPEAAVLVEFAWYRPRAVDDGRQAAPRYAAYLLAARGEAQWVDLGEAAPIDRAANDWRRALRDPRRTDARRLARALDAMVMEPVRTLLGQSQHLLISPDGALNLVPFAALVDEHHKYAVERFTITYLTSGRDLLRLQVPRESRSGPIVAAAPAFGDPALDAANRHVDYSQVFFGPLPGVGREVRALRRLLPEATFLVHEQATEAALRRASGPSILHVATHGFFLADREEVSTSDTGVPATDAGTRLGTSAGAWTDNPLLRSGLAMAGANQGKSGADDGVLTALEAASLDLWGTELVVLSACDTGVGDVEQGDGVYGLRRALVLAGAESQLVSLWPVSDTRTQSLMVGYYTRLLSGEGRAEALRHVQVHMLREPRHAHPYYWASFIQSGEWAGLHANR